MPSLYEMQAAMRESLVRRDSAAVAVMLAKGVPPERLDIYRNTFLFTLTKALGLSFPAVRKLVGSDFFDAAVELFVADHLPCAAWLDRYGEAFPDFLRAFPAATSISYLGDVAQLEWAINCALHAPEADVLDFGRLAAIEREDEDRIRLIATPALQLLHLRHPADDIWRAVMAGDDAALARIDPGDGPHFLVVERRETEIAIESLSSGAWKFLSDLLKGTVGEAIGRAGDLDCAAELAAHFARGRFCAFEVPREHDPEKCEAVLKPSRFGGGESDS